MPYVSRKSLTALKNRAANCKDAYLDARRDERGAVDNLARLATQHDTLTRLVAEYIVAAKGEGLLLAKQVADAGINLTVEYAAAEHAQRDLVDGGTAGPMPVSQALALSQATVRTLLERLAELQAANETAYGAAPRERVA